MTGRDDPMIAHPRDGSRGGFQPRPVAERFWEKVDKTETCWLWTAGMYPGGYGKFSVRSGLSVRAPGPQVVDLMADLEASIKRAKAARRTPKESE